MGAHLLIELLSKGEQVRALKRSSSNLTHTRSVFEFYLKDTAESEFAKIEWVEGDLSDVVSLQDAIEGCNTVYHAAALVSFLKKDFNEMWRINKIGTENVVNVCQGSNVNQLCYISSTASIGKNGVDTFFTEENKWTSDKHNTNYSISKHSAEMEVWRGIEEGLNAVILNPSVILGPGNWNESSISIFKAVKKGLKFYTPGMNAFVDARDVASLAVSAVEKEITGQRYLVVSENLYFKDLFDKIAKAFGVKPPKHLVKPWMASLAWKIEGFLRVIFGRKQNITRETARSSMSISQYSNEKIKTEFNHEFIPIQDSIENAVAYFDFTEQTGS